MTTPPTTENNRLVVETEEVSPCYTQVTVTVPAELIAQDLRHTYQQLAYKHRKSGFKKGQSPISQVKREVSKEEVRQELYQCAIGKYLAEALAELDIEAVAAAQCDILDFEENEPLCFTAVIPTEPKVKLGSYKDVAVWMPVVNVDDQDVDDEIMGLRRAEARLEEKKGAAEYGDFVSVDIDARVNGERRAEESFTDHLIELNQSGPDAHLAEGIVGARKGESKIFAVEAGGNGQESYLINYRTKINKVARVVLPEVDDQFLGRHGAGAIEELKEIVESRLLNRLEETAEEHVKDQILLKLSQLSSFDIPKELIDALLDWHVQEAEKSVQEEHGRSFQDHLKTIGMSPEDYVKDLTERVIKEIKCSAMLLAVAEKQKISPTDQEVAAYARDTGEIQELYLDDTKELVRKLKEMELFEKAYRYVTELKALDFLMSNVNVNKPASRKKRTKKI